MALRLVTGHHAEAVFLDFEHIVDFLLTDSHSLRSCKNRALKYMLRLLTLRAVCKIDLDTIRSMYGHGSILTGKAISAVLGEELGG